VTAGEVITRLLLAGVQMTVAFEPDGEYLDLAPAEAVTPALLRWLAQWPAPPRPGSLAWADWRAGRPPRQGTPGGSPHRVFMAQLHAALDRLTRLDWTGSSGGDGALKADLELDIAAATLDGPDAVAHLPGALEALRRWERAWISSPSGRSPLTDERMTNP
jgi:hypothetical protein